MIRKLILMSALLSSSLIYSCIPTCIQQGPNRLQPAPVLTSATNTNGVINIQGSLATFRKSTEYLIQFFGNPTSTGNTQGCDFLGQATVITDCFGVALFNLTLLPPTQNTDPFISATATLIFCDGTLSDTSEFSANIPVVIS